MEMPKTLDCVESAKGEIKVVERAVGFSKPELISVVTSVDP